MIMACVVCYAWLVKQMEAWFTGNLTLITYISVFSKIPPNAIILRLEDIRKEDQKRKDDLKAAADAQAAQDALDAQVAYNAAQALKTNIPTDNLAGATFSGCGDNQYANFIYMHESGCNTYNPNPSSGACGLGQAWPCSKLLAVCPNLDYACENIWFNNYAEGKGGWPAAYQYWVAHNYW